jgi:hypothetical protein
MTPKQAAAQAERVYKAGQYLIKVVLKWFEEPYSNVDARLKVRDAIIRYRRAEGSEE